MVCDHQRRDLVEARIAAGSNDSYNRMSIRASESLENLVSDIYSID